MQIIFAKNLGFCTGVKRAIEIARQSLKQDPKPVRFLGEIIHNEKIIGEIQKAGGQTIENTKNLENGTLVIRAHGCGPLPEIKNVLIRDATCPLVKRAQNVAQKLKKDGYEVIIIGEKNHPEVIGILENINGQATVVESSLEAEKIKKTKKIGGLAQTTQSQEKIEEILKILKQKAESIDWQNTLCPQVAARQKELKDILKKTDGILVIGSQTSANTQRLVRIAQKSKKNVWCANSVEQLEKLSFKNVKILGVVSGTSAPDWEVKKITNYLKSYAQ
jgi:(E)-4-hydroxy-3-methyl-but-2-enyl pyrophosphate reductase